MERDLEPDAPNLLHRDRWDPALLRAFGYSALVHTAIVVGVLVIGAVGHRAMIPATSYTVGLVDLQSGSPLLDLGPLADKPPGARPTVFAPPADVVAVAPLPAAAAPQPETPPAPEPKPEPKVEAKPEPKPEPKPVAKVEPKPEPKPEPKVEAKPAPKPAPKPEPKKVEAKPAVKPEAKKPEPKPAAKPAAKAEAKSPAKPAAKPAAATTKATSSAKPAAGTGAGTGTASKSTGATSVAKATPPGGGGGSTIPGSGPGGGGPAGAVVRSPEFVSYYESLLRTIRRGWVTQVADSNLRTTVGFSILADGRLANIRSVESSGDSRFDLSVLNAVRAAQGQLGAPPSQYQKDFADVEILFRPSDLVE